MYETASPTQCDDLAGLKFEGSNIFRTHTIPYTDHIVVATVPQFAEVNLVFTPLSTLRIESFSNCDQEFSITTQKKGHSTKTKNRTWQFYSYSLARNQRLTRFRPYLQHAGSLDLADTGYIRSMDPCQLSSVSATRLDAHCFELSLSCPNASRSVVAFQMSVSESCPAFDYCKLDMPFRWVLQRRLHERQMPAILWQSSSDLGQEWALQYAFQEGAF